jgi:hypothetical protein
MTPRERRWRDWFFSVQATDTNDDALECVSILSSMFRKPDGSRRWRSCGVMPPSQPANYRVSCLGFSNILSVRC